MASSYAAAAKSLAHLLDDTKIKSLSASNSDSQRAHEPVAVYLHMVEVQINALKRDHLGGGLTPGGHERMIQGKWSDKP